MCALVMGCYTAELDPDRPGVYRCSFAESCPPNLACIDGTCETPSDGSETEGTGPVPMLSIETPSDLQVFSQGGPDSFQVTITGSDLTLVAQNGEHVPGQGHIVVAVDGRDALTITNGELSTGVDTMIELPTGGGVHRVHVRARRNDGNAYTNPEAQALRTFWLDDGQPHVAIKAPWPNSEIGLTKGPVDLQVEVGVINFAAVSGGHVHVYFRDFRLPECLTMECPYTDLIPSGDPGVAAGTVTLKASPVGLHPLTAVAAVGDHSLYQQADGVVLDEFTIASVE